MILTQEWVIIETLKKDSVWIVVVCLNELLRKVISEPFRASIYDCDKACIPSIVRGFSRAGNKSHASRRVEIFGRPTVNSRTNVSWHMGR
jgi:hypothetical protein